MIERKIPSETAVRQLISQSQGKWWEKQGLESPVVPLADFEAGRGRVPDVVGEFGFYPSSILVLGRPKGLYDYLADNARPERHALNSYHGPQKLSIFPPAASWFAVSYWSRPGDLVLDPFGNRANIGLVANWLSRAVVLNDIVPAYCEMMRTAGRRRARPDLPWTVLNQDAAALTGVEDASVDLVLTGPPYFNLERYESVPGQASAMRSYPLFRRWYDRVAAETLRVAKAGGFCVLKVANWRVKGRLFPFVRDTLKTWEAAGWTWHDELICVEPAPIGLGFAWADKWRKRHVHKAHQTILVFQKSR